jgi:hypothetical protein
VVTNLFSQDLNLIDTELPDATLNTLFCVSSNRTLTVPLLFPTTVSFLFSTTMRFPFPAILPFLLLTIMSFLFPASTANLTRLTGLSSARASGCYAYFVFILGHQLPVSRRPFVSRTEVLLTDFQTAPATRPRD